MEEEKRRKMHAEYLWVGSSSGLDAFHLSHQCPWTAALGCMAAIGWLRSDLVRLVMWILQRTNDWSWDRLHFGKEAVSTPSWSIVFFGCLPRCLDLKGMHSRPRLGMLPPAVLVVGWMVLVCSVVIPGAVSSLPSSASEAYAFLEDSESLWDWFDETKAHRIHHRYNEPPADGGMDPAFAFRDARIPPWVPRPEGSLLLNMLIKNEEEHLERTLPGWAKIIDAWIIGVDDANSDRSEEIIYKHLGHIPGEIVRVHFDGMGSTWSRLVSFGVSKYPQITHGVVSDADFAPLVEAFDKRELDIRCSKHMVRIFGENFQGERRMDWIYRNIPGAVVRRRTHQILDVPRLPNQEVFQTMLKQLTLEERSGGYQDRTGLKTFNYIQLLKEDLRERPRDSRSLSYLARSFIELYLSSLKPGFAEDGSRAAELLTAPGFFDFDFELSPSAAGAGQGKECRDAGEHGYTAAQPPRTAPQMSPRSWKLLSTGLQLFYHHLSLPPELRAGAEEHWITLLKLAEIEERHLRRWERAEALYWLAFLSDPLRAEPLHSIARYYRRIGQTERALAFAAVALHLPGLQEIFRSTHLWYPLYNCYRGLSFAQSLGTIFREEMASPDPRSDPGQLRRTIDAAVQTHFLTLLQYFQTQELTGDERAGLRTEERLFMMQHLFKTQFQELQSRHPDIQQQQQQQQKGRTADEITGGLSEHPEAVEWFTLNAEERIQAVRQSLQRLERRKELLRAETERRRHLRLLCPRVSEVQETLRLFWRGELPAASPPPSPPPSPPASIPFDIVRLIDLKPGGRDWLQLLQDRTRCTPQQQNYVEQILTKLKPP